MSIVEKSLESEWIRKRARRLGFELCGVAPAEKFPELDGFADWLARGYGGEMRYLGDARRADLQSVLPGAKSVIVCALNYNTPLPHSTQAFAEGAENEPRGWISRYAWGQDYHAVIGAKLEELCGALRERFAAPFETRWYVDTGPVHERALAHHAGLGWIGKNTLLLNEEVGSYFFLGVILTTLELAPSLEGEAPPPDLCGNCRLCLDACPTGALTEAYVMDARRCISYLTIELRGAIPEELRAPMGRHVFGCDICQDVCPYNRRAPVDALPAFAPRSWPKKSLPAAAPDESLFLPRLEWLASLSEEEFRELFRGSPIRRSKWRGLLRNVGNALGNAGAQADEETRARIRARLEMLAQSGEELVADSARWALGRLGDMSS
ncbi:MAG: tRNA epoxyqueuosine(34) reductase QueG [Acidobacteriia bacterium]|nr:tRNA epoxyqueuosine(34) reductase QueG [Terriglobia bacterium]